MNRKKINIVIKTLLISAILFCFITFFSHENKLYVDGCESYGLPFSFYEVCADPSPEFISGFKIKYLIFDVSIIVIPIFLY